MITTAATSASRTRAEADLDSRSARAGDFSLAGPVALPQAVRKDDIPDDLSFKAKYLSGIEGWVNPGGSVIVDPDGKLIAGPATVETILYADVRQEQLVGPRWQLDIAGHYARPDVFELIVHRRPTPVIREHRDPSTPSAPQHLGHGGDDHLSNKRLQPAKARKKVVASKPSRSRLKRGVSPRSRV
jgi:hypothetical protein